MAANSFSGLGQFRGIGSRRHGASSRTKLIEKRTSSARIGAMSQAPEQNYWRKCSACKRPIGFGQIYQECSVSTCSRKRSGFAFCSVPCWASHVPTFRHRDAWALEKTAPTKEQFLKEQAEETADT